MAYQSKKIQIELSSLCLFAVVIMAFCHHFFIYGNSYFGYVVLFLLMTIMAIVLKRKLAINIHSIGWIWVLAAVAMLYSFFVVSNKYGAARNDVLILLISMFFCALLRYKDRDYVQCLKIAMFLGGVHAFGVVTQQILPSVHRIFVLFLPSDLASIVMAKSNNGFTVNSGFAACFICVGILVLGALIHGEYKLTIKYKLLMILLLMGLLLTGKRAHPLFLAICMLTCYFLPLRGVKTLKKYWIAFLVFVVAVLLFFALKDALVTIPFFASVIETVDGLVMGTDITSSRSVLITWAWTLFSENPIVGIGWGEFRKTVIGNVTRVTEFDTHNIYMQLLCETGIVGFTCFVIPMLVFWFNAKEIFCKCARNESLVSGMWKSVNYFSFSFQTLFLLYGFTGNPLYDPNWVIMYMICCGMTMSYLSVEKNTKSPANKCQ